MKERPLILKDYAIRAILAGHKTQDRRIVKPQPDRYHDGEPYWFVGGYRAWKWRDCDDVLRRGGNDLKCPYGEPGERLWVKETWAYEGTDGSSILPIQYRADRTDWLECSKWKRSIIMPRQVSRINLQASNVCIERLQDITERGAKDEGVEPYAPDDGRYVAGFKLLWDSIHGIGSWDANPLVWVARGLKRV